MRERPGCRFCSIPLALWLAVAPLGSAAAETPPTPVVPPAAADTPTSSASLDEAREQIKSGDYDHAIEILKTAIAESHEQAARLREAYLLLIKTYVFLGNDYKFKPQGREASNLNYRAARELIEEVLKTKDLRHLTPEPASEYPPEMIGFFGEVRSQIFGAFRVASLRPSKAIVTLDADTLASFPGDTLPGEVDLGIGTHTVVVRHPGYRILTEEIVISPNSTLARSYELSKRRGKLWFATRATGVAGVLGGLIGLVVGNRGGTPAAKPLPPAPPPPTN